MCKSKGWTMYSWIHGRWLCFEFFYCTANHNAYECYPSPFVSWRLIERTIWANQHPNNPAAWGPWNPFLQDDAAAPDPGYYPFPANAMPTENLLGYHLPERCLKLSIDSIPLICDTSDSVDGQIRYCSEATARVSASVMRTNSKTHTGFPLPVGGKFRLRMETIIRKVWQ